MDLSKLLKSVKKNIHKTKLGKASNLINSFKSKLMI